MDFLKKYWWKVLTVILLSWTVIGGLLVPVPDLPVLNESSRNLFFHVPMWYVMLTAFLVSAISAILFLKTEKEKYDQISVTFIQVGLTFGCMGLVTGMIWASGTWGKPWNNDPKQVGSALTLFTYMAYMVLRNSIKNKNQIGRIAAVYNIFAIALIIPLLYIIPARLEGLHPGSAEDDLLATLRDQSADFRIVFLPAIIGWIMLGVWIFNINFRINKLEAKNEI